MVYNNDSQNPSDQLQSYQKIVTVDIIKVSFPYIIV